jgi:heat shock transcription factor
MPSRKRAAPGATPVPPQNPPAFGYPQGLPVAPLPTDPSYVNWTPQTEFKPYTVGGFDAFSNGLPAYDGINPGFSEPLGGDADVKFEDPTVQIPGQLVRRSTNQHLALQPNLTWDTIAAPDQQAAWEEVEDDEDELDRQALEAKKDAMSKKRQIPPFIQKISR